MIPLILFPFLVVIFAMPLYILDANGGIKNDQFAQLYVITILIFSIILWVHALYQARAFFDVQRPNNKGSDKIINEIEG